jgi:hypothetical protein
VFIKFFANLGKRATESLAMIIQAFKEESMEKFRLMVTEKGKQVRSKVKEHAHNFL